MTSDTTVDFWAGEFGNEYIARNYGEAFFQSNKNLFTDILKHCAPISSAFEMGANIGANLQTLNALVPAVQLAAVEINPGAVEHLRRWGKAEVHHSDLLHFNASVEVDFSFSKGVLIHIPPAELSKAYELLYRTSRRYVCVIEYYNPKPVEVEYRGHEGKLWKRDFAGEMMDQYPNLKLVSHGFAYHRDDRFFELDDVTWFLLEKAPAL